MFQFAVTPAFPLAGVGLKLAAPHSGKAACHLLLRQVQTGPGCSSCIFPRHLTDSQTPASWWGASCTPPNLSCYWPLLQLPEGPQAITFQSTLHAPSHLNSPLQFTFSPMGNGLQLSPGAMLPPPSQPITIGLCLNAGSSVICQCL